MNVIIIFLVNHFFSKLKQSAQSSKLHFSSLQLAYPFKEGYLKHESHY